MNKPSIVYLNGRFIPKSEAFIPVTDKGFIYGQGAFTTMCLESGYILNYDLHILRLKKTCAFLNITYPPLIETTFLQLISLNSATQNSWKIKVIITDETCLIEISPFEIVKKMQKVTLYPFPMQSPLLCYKTLAYLDRILVKKFSLQQGFDDAIVTNGSGFILETSFSNIFWTKQKTIFIPASHLQNLRGTILERIQETGYLLGYTIKYVEKTVEDLSVDTSLYICNSLQMILPVFAMNQKKFKIDGIEYQRLQKTTTHLSFKFSLKV
ncbi:MAG: hypothetical protein BGO10_07310 [Chlamydia sp. 32-24]|nr:MAG: hypothetical protein BGO10_07310 [Chlamydia sp. 32-24]